MKLEEFIKKNKISKTDFAKQVGIAFFTLDRYFKGRIPSPDIMVQIVKATKGVVQPNDFYDLGKKK